MDVDLQVSILLAAALIGILIAKRFGQSAILGEILIGIIIGPSLLGLVAYNDAVKVLAELGAVVMLFLIGLDCNYKELYTTKNIGVALLGVILPFIGGWWLAHLFHYSGAEGLFVGVALTATSIAITARVLQERNLLSTPVAKTILGAAVVDDILGLLCLSVIVNLHGDANWSAIGLQAAIAIGFVIGALLMIPLVNKLLAIFERKAEEWGESQAPLFTAMIVAFCYAGIAHFIGLSSIVGAFIAGVTLEPRPTKSFKEGVSYIETLFAAIFFVSLGVLADVRQLQGAWIFAILLIAVAAITKLVGCMIPALIARHSVRESLAIGAGMIPRGEVAMIVGVIGLTSGALGQGLYGAIIVMAFVTTVITPWLLNILLPIEKSVQRS